MGKNDEWVTQCELRQLVQGGYRPYVAYIPKALARVGSTITLKDIEGQWVIHAVYASMLASEAQERSRDHAHQREASDV